MRTKTVSRRMMLSAGTCALGATTLLKSIENAYAEAGLNADSEDIIRRYYAAWETTDWQPFDALLTDDFTFTSANNDDHISKGVFKTRCWDSQKSFIARFDLQHVVGTGNEAFVMYVGRTHNGRNFRNVEYLRLRDHQVEAIECYFGAQSSFASAASAG